MPLSETDPRAPHHTKFAASPNTISTLSELRCTAATGDWPSEGLAVRAGILATSRTPESALLGIADGRYMRAARLWLQIAYYLHDAEELTAVLTLAARCASLGGNYSFARNCMKRAGAAACAQHGYAAAAV